MYGVNWINAPTIFVYHKDILGEYTGGDRLDVEYYHELFFVFILSNFLHSFSGGIYGDSGEIIFHSGETQEAFVWLKRFIKKGHVNALDRQICLSL